MSVFLAHRSHVKVCNDTTVGVTQLTVSHLGAKLIGTAVFRQRQTTGIQQDLAGSLVVADDSAEHAHGDLFSGADPARLLIHIEDGIDTGA